MIILTIRTDKPEAELGLYEDDQQLAYSTWEAHRQLAETIHLKIKDLLQNQQKQLSDLNGVVVFKGPGSFTGLRIGISVANALAGSLQLHIVGASQDDWINTGVKALLADENHSMVLPEYGALPNITKPKH